MKLSREILMNINIYPLKNLVVGFIMSFFFTAKLFMLQERVVSNSMLDFVLGHFLSSFCFSLISFVLFFLCFFCLDFFIEKTSLFLFSFVSLRSFFSLQNIRRSDPNLLFCLDILLLFASQKFQTRQNQKYPGRKCSNSV